MYCHFVTYDFRSELNLGIQPAGFTVVKNCRPVDEHKTLMKVGSSCIILPNKSLISYMNHFMHFYIISFE